MRGAFTKARLAGEQDIALAYATGNFVQADPKKLKPLAYYLPKPDRPAQSGGSMLDKLKRLAAATKR